MRTPTGECRYNGECDYRFGKEHCGSASALPALLSAVICKAFNNEEDFLKDLTNGLECTELLECYMASERTKIVVLTHDGQHVTTTIPTVDFLDWCEGR